MDIHAPEIPSTMMIPDADEAPVYDSPILSSSSMDDVENSVLLTHQANRESPERKETADRVLSELGTWNPFVIFVFLSMSFVWALGAMPMMASAFMMGDVCTFDDPEACNFTAGTITEEFRLSGRWSYLADWTTSSFLLGNMVGGSVLSRLSDCYGRRPVLLSAMLMFGTTGLLSSVAPNIYALAFTRFLQGIFFTGCGLTNWALAYESAPASLRTYASMTFGIFWVIGYSALAPLAYFVPQWRRLIAFASAPSLLFAVLFYFVIPESFHYLVSKRRKEDVIDWVNTAARWQRTDRVLKVDVDALISNAQRIHDASLNKDGSAKGLIKHLTSNRLLLLYTIVLAYLWTCDTFVYYGLSLFSTQLAGDRYVNYALSGLVEVPCYLTMPFLLNKLGRRKFVSITHLITSLCFLFLIFSESGTTLTLCIWMVGKFAISCAFTSIFVYGSEVFPTVYRTGCIGMCEVVARFGGVFAPAVRTMTVVLPSLPMIFFSAMSGVASLLTLVLPETKNAELPDSPIQIAKRRPKKLTTVA